MYSHYELEQSLLDEYDTGVVEYKGSFTRVVILFAFVMYFGLHCLSVVVFTLGDGRYRQTSQGIITNASIRSEQALITSI